MTQTSDPRPTDPRPRPWIAFLAGAVVMLAIVLVWMAWNATRSAITSTLRADMALPHRSALPLPRTPPPEGPHLPKPPVPTPR
jgi:hypothetical protein